MNVIYHNGCKERTVEKCNRLLSTPTSAMAYNMYSYNGEVQATVVLGKGKGKGKGVFSGMQSATASCY